MFTRIKGARFCHRFNPRLNTQTERIFIYSESVAKISWKSQLELVAGATPA